MALETHNPVLSVLFLVADLAACGDSAPVRVLAQALSRDRFRVSVGILGSASGGLCEELQAAGIKILPLPMRRFFDVKGARLLKHVVLALNPTIVHTWGAVAAGAARLLVSGQRDGTNRPRLVVSAAATSSGGIGGWLATRQIRRADRVVSTTRVDGKRYRKIGVPSERLTLINPASSAFDREATRDDLCKIFGIPPQSLLLITGGRSSRGIGPKDAIVAFDMLRYDNPHLHLIVFGSGTEAASLEHFGRALAFDDFRIRFANSETERAAAVTIASAVLITQTQGGVEEALEAMAAGKPVVAWQTPELLEIVDNGVSGFLVPVGDRAALAFRTRKLLEEPGLATKMGEAGRARVAARFSAGRMIERFSRLYVELAGFKS